MTTPIFSWLKERSTGLLLHPTSLPGDCGIGNFGPEAYRLVDFIESAQMRYWQICPLGPTGYGDSPYQCFSAFAGNPYLIDLRALVKLKLLKDEELKGLRALSRDRVDYGGLYQNFWPVIRKAYDRFAKKPSVLSEYGDFEKFKSVHHDWLHPYACFRALKNYFGGKPWFEWSGEFRTYQKAVKNPLVEELEDEINAESFLVKLTILFFKLFAATFF